ncbi:helix-turn-helix transcriptional regulator [Sphingomonas sp. BK580]|uniref:helix-turn-helix transcriptional regulator n=1 Tax=Sphingomonas sp. BK580 TaxID=2586972 RepID=UPI001607C9A4|nr:helix-turn-helix transcriptional regulator [Sphingomonas sp. BK580]MBB3695626.1 transcriptional regulator with XRE-family HTH domain [Sphingomonas sp. BK580]
MSLVAENELGNFLKDRRARLDPAALGFGTSRRRTPGLRREEVANRANVSATWYTWLEQGRGGAPSADVLDRLARALILDPNEREHLFMLAQHRPPEPRYAGPAPVSARLRSILDALEFSPALVITSAFDIVAWNRAATAVLVDYAALAVDQRNVLRLLFGNALVRAGVRDWEDEARLAVARFRLEVSKAGASEAVQSLVDDLSEASPEFRSMWLENEVRPYGEGTKHVDHPKAGPLTLEYSSMSIDGQPNLSLVIYTAATPADRKLIASLLDR